MELVEKLLWAASNLEDLISLLMTSLIFVMTLLFPHTFVWGMNFVFSVLDEYGL